MKIVNKPDIIGSWRQVCFGDNLKASEMLFYWCNLRLIKFCSFYVGQKEAVEEIVSDVFVKCWQCRKNLTGKINPESYLFAGNTISLRFTGYPATRLSSNGELMFRHIKNGIGVNEEDIEIPPGKQLLCLF